jgi:hypothetical protein
MDGKFYSKILFHNFFRFFCANRNIRKLHQDNDPKHKSKVCMKTLSDLNIKWANIYFFF